MAADLASGTSTLKRKPSRSRKNELASVSMVAVPWAPGKWRPGNTLHHSTYLVSVILNAAEALPFLAPQNKSRVFAPRSR